MGSTPRTPIVLSDLVVAGRHGFSVGPLSVELAPGTITAVVGPARSGKSLLLRGLAGLAPTAGHLGNSRVAMAFQRDALLDELDALGNVTLGCPRDTLANMEQRARWALGVVGLSEAAAKRPDQLSGGMRRRVGLARALASDAELLLLDDVTAGLDPSTAAEVMGSVSELAARQGQAVLAAVADTGPVLAVADQVIVLDGGRPLYVGPVPGLDDTPETSVYL